MTALTLARELRQELVFYAATVTRITVNKGSSPYRHVDQYKTLTRRSGRS